MPTAGHKKIFQSIGFIFIMAVVSSCQPQVNPNSPLQQALNQASKGGQIPSFESYILSSNGNWLSIIKDGKLMVEPTFTSGSTKLFDLHDVGKYPYPYTIEWSPGNTMVAVSGSSEWGPYSEDSIGILKVTDTREKLVTFNLPNGDKGNLGATWSPDGSHIAIYNGKNRIIYILDIDGRLIRRIEFNDQPRINATWTAKGLIVDVDNGGISEIRIYSDPLASESYKVLLKGHYSIARANSESGDILLFKRDGDLRTLDSATQETKTVAQLKGSVYYLSKESIPSRWIGFIVSPPSSPNIKDHHLYIFDWETNQVKDYGEAVFLFGWSSDMNGFIVAKDDPKGYQVDIVKP